MYILGISAYYHDSAACLLFNGHIIAAAQEERFSRIKQDSRFPRAAILYCLEAAKIPFSAIDHIAFYEKPLLKFERILESYYHHAPKGIRSFLKSMPLWIKEKVLLKKQIRAELTALSGMSQKNRRILFPEHHLSHAASAFYPSPFEAAAYLTLDGVGEFATTTFGIGQGHHLKKLGQIDFPHSLGLLYSAFTYFCGFRVNAGEYKLMGLAPYGQPVFKELIYKHLIDLKADGSFQLKMDYFTYEHSLRMTGKKFARLFGGPPRKPESPIQQREKDLAASIQVVIEEILLKIGQHIARQSGQKNLVMAGGVALNCVANGKLLRSGLYEDIWIQPAAGDAGGALGAALAAHHIYLDQKREVVGSKDYMHHTLLGPKYDKPHMQAFINQYQPKYQHYQEEDDLIQEIVSRLLQNQALGWFQGRMEFGPRALGNRSILANPQSPNMQEILNQKIKFRESFRPFAPIVLAEKAAEFFEIDRESPYMLLVAQVRPEKRALLPAITHVDGSARIQTLRQETNSRLHKLLTAFYEQSGCPVLINTSFNVRGEPIVNRPEDAWKCFMKSGLDALVMADYFFDKASQKG